MKLDTLDYILMNKKIGIKNILKFRSNSREKGVKNCKIFQKNIN